MTTILQRTIAVLLLLILAGCGSRDPERVVRDQLQAFTEGDLEKFRGYFASAAASTVSDAMIAANRLALQRTSEGVDTSSGPGQENPVEIMASRAIAGDLVELEILSKRSERHRIEMIAQITYPDPRTLSTDAYRQMIAERTGLSVERVDQGVLDSMSVVLGALPEHAQEELRAQQAALMKAAYQTTPERFRKLVEGTYVLERRWGQWEVLEEPITTALLNERA